MRRGEPHRSGFDNVLTRPAWVGFRPGADGRGNSWVEVNAVNTDGQSFGSSIASLVMYGGTLACMFLATLIDLSGFSDRASLMITLGGFPILAVAAFILSASLGNFIAAVLVNKFDSDAWVAAKIGIDRVAYLPRRAGRFGNRLKSRR